MSAATIPTSGEVDVFPCCEHCGPVTEDPAPGAVYGSGYGHPTPCPDCQPTDGGAS